MPEGSRAEMGGTMRLGARKSIILKDSLAYQVYGYQSEVTERHRHRYEVNPDLVALLEADAGLSFSARDDSGQRMEMVELPHEVHPFFLAVQFHPEFKSRPTRPSPPFLAFVQASAGVFVRKVSNRSATPALNGGTRPGTPQLIDASEAEPPAAKKAKPNA